MFRRAEAYGPAHRLACTEPAPLDVWVASGPGIVHCTGGASEALSRRLPTARRPVPAGMTAHAKADW